MIYNFGYGIVGIKRNASHKFILPGCAMESGGQGVVACLGDTNNPTPMSVAKAAQGCDCEDSSCSIGWKFQ